MSLLVTPSSGWCRGRNGGRGGTGDVHRAAAGHEALLRLSADGETPRLRHDLTRGRTTLVRSPRWPTIAAWCQRTLHASDIGTSRDRPPGRPTTTAAPSDGLATRGGGDRRGTAAGAVSSHGGSPQRHDVRSPRSLARPGAAPPGVDAGRRPSRSHLSERGIEVRGPPARRGVDRRHRPRSRCGHRRRRARRRGHARTTHTPSGRVRSLRSPRRGAVSGWAATCCSSCWTLPSPAACAASPAPSRPTHDQRGGCVARPAAHVRALRSADRSGRDPSSAYLSVRVRVGEA
jgi:hypothetical protein